MDSNNQALIPIYELAEDGSVLPNPVFHRSWDKMHSRCIEYPFAASRLGDAERVLDVGIAKADKIWIRWLDSLPIEVHGTDFDEFEYPSQRIVFHKADVRNLQGIKSDFFDRIFAVSVIEHIGLSSPQVNSETLPRFDEEGDLEAFCELVRALKKGGEIVMTFPFSVNGGLVRSGDARIYNAARLKKFEKCAKPITLDYYEYQFSSYKRIYWEYPPEKSRFRKIWDLFFPEKKKDFPCEEVRSQFASGAVTWRRIPMRDCRAAHVGHIDGVLCSVWRKE